MFSSSSTHGEADGKHEAKSEIEKCVQEGVSICMFVAFSPMSATMGDVSIAQRSRTWKGGRVCVVPLVFVWLCRQKQRTVAISGWPSQLNSPAKQSHLKGVQQCTSRTLICILGGHDYPSTESNQSSSFASSVAKGRGGPFFFKSGGSALRGLAVDVEEDKVEGDKVERIAEPPVRGAEGSLIGVDDDEGGGVGEVAVLALP